MARRFIIALFAALVLSSIAVFFLYRTMSNNKPVVQAPFQYVAVAHAVDPGDILKKEDLTTISWPHANPLAGSFTSIDAVAGRVVLYPLAASQPVLDQEMATAGAGLGVTGRIPQGMRAIALKSDEVVGVAGFLMPATHVDVLVTYRPENNSDPQTATVLQDAEVLAVGHELQPDPSGKPANVTLVTPGRDRKSSAGFRRITAGTGNPPASRRPAGWSPRPAAAARPRAGHRHRPAASPRSAV